MERVCTYVSRSIDGIASVSVISCQLVEVSWRLSASQAWRGACTSVISSSGKASEWVVHRVMSRKMPLEPVTPSLPASVPLYFTAPNNLRQLTTGYYSLPLQLKCAVSANSICLHDDSYETPGLNSTTKSRLPSAPLPPSRNVLDATQVQEWMVPGCPGRIISVFGSPQSSCLALPQSTSPKTVPLIGPGL